MMRALAEINGVKYMAPKAAGDLWKISRQRVTAACKDGRVVGVCFDLKGHYMIPVNSKKPLERETIREV